MPVPGVVYFIASSFRPQHGVGDSVAGFFLARSLMKAGFDVRVIVPAYDCLDDPVFVSRAGAKKIAHLDNGIDVFQGSWEGITLFFLSGGYLGISRRFDISNPHLPVGRAADLCSSLGFFDFSGSIVHIRDPYFAPAAGYLKGRGVPVVFEAHMHYGPWALFDPAVVSSLGLGFCREPFLHGSKVSFEKIGLELSDAVAVVSPWLRQDICSFYGDYSKKMDIVANGIDLGFFSPSGVNVSREVFFSSRGMPDPAGKRVLLHASSLDFRKGTDLVVCAAGELLQERDDLLFVFSGRFGSAEYEDRVLSLVSQYPDSACYIGHTDHADMPALYCFSDVLLHPSRYDPSPLAVLEAASMGVLPVVSDLPVFAGMPWLGFRCRLEPGSLYGKIPIALGKIDGFKASVPSLRESFAKKHSWDAQAAQFVSIYSKML